MTKIGDFIDHVIDYLAYFSAILIFFVFLSVCTEVFTRFFFNMPLSWVIEIAEYALVSIAFLSAAWVLKKEAHVFLDIALNILSPKGQILTNTIISALGVIICLVVTWYGADTVLYHFREGTTMPEKSLQMMTAPLLTVVPIGFFFLSIQFIKRTYGFWYKLKTGPVKEERRIEELVEF